MTAWRWWWTPKGSESRYEVEIVAWLESFVIVLPIDEPPDFDGEPIYVKSDDLRAERITR
jgi:hypothetical protein